MAHLATLAWLAPISGDAPTSYKAYRATSAGGPFALLGSSGSTLSFIDSTVVAGNTYFWQVTAVNSAGESGPSNQVTASIPFSVPNAPSALAVSIT